MSGIGTVLAAIMDDQRFAVLATLGNGVPYTNLVAFASADNLAKIIFLTPRDTSKFRNICGSPGVSLFIDNRSNRASDITSAVGISITGTATVLDNRMKAGMLRLYLERHPYLADFAQDDDTALICVAVSRYSVVRNFTCVEVVYPGDLR